MTDDLARPAAVGAALAEALGDERWRDAEASLIAGGKSNLTYALTSSAGEAVLRRPPSGELLPRAHDMARETRVQRALGPTPVPVPRILLADDGGLLGVPCYVMERAPGIVVRDEPPPGFDAAAASRGLVDTLADLHAVDVLSAGLSDYGRPTGFMSRQLRTWAGQWERAATHEVPEVSELLRRLRSAPFAEDPPAALVHGDYRLDNLLLGPDGRVTAVLDWELSTLGDPLADLGMLLFYWREAGEPAPVLTPATTSLPGFPTRAEVAQRYAARTGADLTLLPSYLAFAHLKFAAIAQGIAARSKAGSMAGQDFGDLDDEVVRIAVEGLDRLGS